MPIYYSQNNIQKTQEKLKKYMKKIENHYLRFEIKYEYIKKFYKLLNNKKSMISSTITPLSEDIISFVKNDSSSHKRFITYHHPSNSTLVNVIENIDVLIRTNASLRRIPSEEVSVCSSESEDTSDTSESNDSSED